MPRFHKYMATMMLLHNGKAWTGITRQLWDSERLPPIWDVWLLWDIKDVKSLIAELCHAVERGQGLAMSNEGKNVVEIFQSFSRELPRRRMTSHQVIAQTAAEPWL